VRCPALRGGACRNRRRGYSIKNKGARCSSATPHVDDAGIACQACHLDPFLSVTAQQATMKEMQQGKRGACHDGKKPSKEGRLFEVP
jgi:c(7)-type cytochrome triheme protein